MAGICRVAWKILRGAVVASTAMVTLGAVAEKTGSARAQKKSVSQKPDEFHCCSLLVD